MEYLSPSLSVIDLTNKLDSIFLESITRKKLAGAVATVSYKGNIIYRKAHGLSCLKSHAPMKTETKFRLSSISKPIVTAALLRLVAADEVKLEDPVTNWLPYFTPKDRNGNQPEINLHQLITHSSGLSYSFQEPSNSQYSNLKISDGLDCSGLSLEDNLKLLSKADLKFLPGKDWNYSLGLDVVGAVIEKVTNKNLEDAINELVSLPLNINELGFVCPSDVELAIPYFNDRSELSQINDSMCIPSPDNTGGFIKFSPSRAYNKKEYLSGGAGMYGNIDAVTVILESLRNSNSFIKKEIRDSIFQPHISSRSMSLGPGWGFGYGGALLVDPDIANTPQKKGTLSWGGVYGHSWFIDPITELTVVLLTNTAYEGMMGDLTINLRDEIYRHIC
ncbi:beta-lactamase family protein [Xenorhabdus sp. 18]|nr:beta-lactamase family protein [Xenorhabdus sp. 18]